MNLVKKILATAGFIGALSLTSCSEVNDTKYDKLYFRSKADVITLGFDSKNKGEETERYVYKVIPGSVRINNRGVLAGKLGLIGVQDDRDNNRYFKEEEFVPEKIFGIFDTVDKKYKLISFQMYERIQKCEGIELYDGKLTITLDSDEDGIGDVKYYYQEWVRPESVNDLILGELDLEAIQVDKNKNGIFEKNEFILDRVGLSNVYPDKEDLTEKTISI